MTERERLIELLTEAPEIMDCPQPHEVADHLLANGVMLVDTEAVCLVTNREPIRTAFGMPLDELAELIRAKQIEEMARTICEPTANKGNCEKCGFKKKCSKFDDATDLYNAGYRKQSEGEDTNVPTKWINVEDRLPAYGELVLVSAKDLVTEEHKWFYLARYKDNNWYGEENYMFGRVAHWMPLPDAPKGE